MLNTPVCMCHFLPLVNVENPYPYKYQVSNNHSFQFLSQIQSSSKSCPPPVNMLKIEKPANINGNKISIFDKSPSMPFWDDVQTKQKNPQLSIVKLKSQSQVPSGSSQIQSLIPNSAIFTPSNPPYPNFYRVWGCTLYPSKDSSQWS